jgi:hypothetical protein
MITKFKIFEKLSKSKLNDFIYSIKEYVTEITFDDDFDADISYDECPYDNEIAVLHQQEYVDEIYEYFLEEYDDYNFIENYNISLEDFKKIYNDMIIKAKEKILKLLLKNPSLYSKYPVPDYEGLEIPDWIRSHKKFNL